MEEAEDKFFEFQELLAGWKSEQKSQLDVALPFPYPRKVIAEYTPGIYYTSFFDNLVEVSSDENVVLYLTLVICFYFSISIYLGFQALKVGLCVKCSPHYTILLLLEDLAARLPSNYFKKSGDTVFEVMLEQFQRNNVSTRVSALECPPTFFLGFKQIMGFPSTGHVGKLLQNDSNIPGSSKRKGTGKRPIGLL